MSDNIRYKRKLVGAKIETTYGGDANPGAANAIQTTGVELTPLAGDTVSRELEREYYGNSEQLHVNSHQVLTFKVEMAGSGTAGAVPGWGVLMRACGFAETVAGGSHVDYTPISQAEESITLYLNRDGQLHKLTGARGTMSLELASNAIPRFSFTFTGLWNDPASVASVTPNFTAFQVPKHASRANTPTLTLLGLSPGTSTISYDHANEVTHRELIGVDNEVMITNRVPAGSITIDEPKLSVKNYYTSVKDTSTGAFALTHGSAAGNIIELTAPKVQLNTPALSDANGVTQLQMAMAFLPQNGNDEIKIRVK